MELVNNNIAIFLPQNIRCLRKRLNLSQEELAGRIGLNRGNIASYENGTAEPKICNLLKISYLFGVSILDLTQRDLSQEENLPTIPGVFQHITDDEQEILSQFLEKAEEIEQVFKGLYTCCRFRASTMGELPKDMQILWSNFEQLYEAAQTMMCNHKALLEFFQHRLK